MPDLRSDQLPFLLKLLDDPSPVVQQEITRAFTLLAPELPALFEHYQVPWEQRIVVHRALWPTRKARLLTSWSQWQRGETGWRALEQVHDALSQFSCGVCQPQTLAHQLDRLAEQFLESQGDRPASAGELAQFLFSQRFQGDSEHYYSPDNSFLSRVVRRGRGNPMSLCCLFVLVGQRLSLPVWGCNFPGHFLARCDQGQELFLYDCFEKGRQMDLQLTPQLRGQLKPAQIETLCRAPLSVAQIVLRILRNLVGAYLNEEKRSDANLFFLLLKDLVAREKGHGQGLPLREPVFHPGQLVHHRDKDYRGVVVDYELYVADASGPVHEPVYRILVHRSPQVSSARESALDHDSSGNLVAHPFVSYFFSKFEGGVYYRNAKPWEKP